VTRKSTQEPQEGRHRNRGVMSEYQCVAFVCQVATENYPLPDEARVTTGVRARTRIELERVLQNRLVDFGPRKIRERELVATRIQHDGRLEGLSARGVLSTQQSGRMRVHFEWQPLITDIETLIDFGLALMLDSSRPQFSRIRQCALDSCGMYFVQINTRSGRPSHFCCPSHSDKQRSIDSTLRKQRQRARLKK